jgi:hypothetical protein
MVMVPAFDPIFLIGISIFLSCLKTKVPTLSTFGITNIDLGVSASRITYCLKEFPMTIILS